MVRKLIILAVCCLGLSGCGGIFDIFLPISSKINKAFPLNSEVRVAEEGLRALIKSDKAISSFFDEEYASLLEIRALTCSQGIKIGRLSSVETIRSLPLSRDCLSIQDAQLLKYLGIRQVAVLVAQGPLRPIRPLGKPWSVPPVAEMDITSADAASAAGVAVLRGNRSEFVSIEIPGGNKIATLPTVFDVSHRVLLSPNGRVAAMQISNRSVLFVNTETGGKIFESSEINRFHAWLPEISAALVNERKNGTLSIIDFKAAKIIRHPIGLRGQNWAIPLAKSSSRVLVGSGGVFSVIEHAQNSEGIQGKLITEYKMRDGNGATSSSPTLMSNGKVIIFTTGRDLKMFDLESGQETLWKTGAFLANRYAKLSESTLLVDSYAVTGIKTKPWVFNVDDATLSPVESENGNAGIIQELVGRTGFARRGSKMWFGDEVSTGEPAALDALLGSFNLERQIARLETDIRAAEGDGALPRTGTPVFAPTPTPDQAERDRMQSIGSQSGGRAASGSIANLARNSLVEAVGVYQGKMGGQATTSERRKGIVEVIVRRSTSPIVLVLSSYEPVRWQLVREPGANLAAILVSGYYPSEVIGAGGIQVVMNGNSFAYKFESREYVSLNRDVLRLTGKNIGIFQGRYEGESFSVGG